MKILAFVTDFGMQDHFIGVMKGVVKKIDPEIDIVDLANEIPSYNLAAASFVVDKNFAYFPQGTVFLVVVDPGVGTDRKILLVEHGGYYFIAPDNGVLTPVLRKDEKRVWVIVKNRFFLVEGTSTFEARDKMAPVAAHLLKGVNPAEFARETAEFILNEHYFPIKLDDSIVGRIVYIDRFGNCITNVPRDYLFYILSTSRFKKFRVKIKDTDIIEYCDTYARGGDEPFMLTGSHQNLEIAMNRASAAQYLNISLNQKILIKFD